MRRGCGCKNRCPSNGATASSSLPPPRKRCGAYWWRRPAVAWQPSGAGEVAEPLDELHLAAPAPDERILGIHEVLDQLEKEDEMEARIVKLRFFAGMTNAEIAALLEVSERTVERHWKLAKVWLYRAMNDE